MSAGHKREWASSPSDVADTGAAIEHEMKRLRLAYDYNADANVGWTPPPRLVDDEDAEMEAVDGHEDPRGEDGAAAEYAQANALLREMHFLRQLRKFQAARSVADRHQQQQQQLQHLQQHSPPAALLRDPRY